MRHEAPLLQLVDQLFPERQEVDVEGAVRQGLERVGLHALVTRGMRVAITAGSRGIAGLPAVLRATVAGPLFPLPYDENGDLVSPFA